VIVSPSRTGIVVLMNTVFGRKGPMPQSLASNVVYMNRFRLVRCSAFFVSTQWKPHPAAILIVQRSLAGCAPANVFCPDQDAQCRRDQANASLGGNAPDRELPAQFGEYRRASPPLSSRGSRPCSTVVPPWLPSVKRMHANSSRALTWALAGVERESTRARLRTRRFAAWGSAPPRRPQPPRPRMEISTTPLDHR